MKKLFTLFALIFTVIINAQTTGTRYPSKIFNGTITSINGAGDSDLLIEMVGKDGKKEYKTLKFAYADDGKLIINPEANDIRNAPGVGFRLNPKYAGKKAKITCREEPLGSEDGTTYIYWVEKIEEASRPTYPNATCKAFNNEGQGFIVENQIIYALDANGEKGSDKWTIQNKDEICLRGNKCVKVKLEANGCVKLYNLPNVTDVTASLKIVGDKIYRTIEGGCEADTKKEHLNFTGNKTQVAIIAVLYRLGMGH